MNKSDKVRFAHIMKASFEVYGKGISDIAMQMYWNVLECYDIKQVENGLAAHLSDPKSGQYPPKPADVIRHITGGNVEDREAVASYAFTRAYNAIGTSGGIYASVAFDDPAIHFSIMLMGGWEAFCSMDETVLDFKRRDFIKGYMAYKPGAPYPSHLIGLIEKQNDASLGVNETEISYIGDRDKAIEVEKRGRESAGMEKIGMHKLEDMVA